MSICLLIFFGLLFIWTISLFIPSGNESPDDQISRLDSIKGFISKGPTNQIVPWWWCSGKDFFENRITQHNIEIYTPPFNNYLLEYYAKSAIRTFQHRAKSELKLTIKEEQISVNSIEKWQDYSTGIHGFVNLKIDTTKQSNITIEYDDNLSDPLSMNINQFKDNKDKLVWFIVTVHNRPSHFKRFLQSIEKLYLSGDKNWGLCIGTFYENSKSHVSISDEEKEMKAYQMKYPNWKVIINKNELPFKKAPVLHRCIVSSSSSSSSNDDKNSNLMIHDDDILFMIDVDCTFEPSIINQIRRYVSKGKRAYSPIVWYRDTDEDGNYYKRNHVGFATGGVGIISLYKSDYIKSGGYDISTFGDQHGFEDTDLFFRIKSSHNQIVRTYERDLQHWPHPRNTWESKAERDVNSLCPN